MPTVLRVDGFQVRIYTDDHTDRAHVHVFRAGRQIIINLPTATRRMAVREVRHMTAAHGREAFRIVAAHAEQLLTEWRKIHGEAGTE